MSLFLYESYAKNLAEIRNHPQFNIKPDWDGSFCCPMCMKVFPIEAVEEKFITKEHVPPKSLGGKVRTLTCRDCNNKAGSDLESELGKKLQFAKFLSGNSTQPINIKYFLNEHQEILLNADFNITEDGWEIIGIPERSKPSDIQKINILANSEGIDSLNIQIPLYKKSHSIAALLRIAYLWAFSIFGYYFIILPQMATVRRQINLPTEKILGESILIDASKIPDEFVGLNVVKSDNTKGLLVVFDLKIEGLAKRFATLLPGLNDNPLSIYNIPEKTNLKLKHIPEDYTHQQSPFILLDIWKSLS